MLTQHKTTLFISAVFGVCVSLFLYTKLFIPKNNDLPGLNIALKKSNQYPMGVCPGPTFIFLGKYTGADTMKKTALRLLRKRNPWIEESDLIEKKNPMQLMNFTTVPPTPSTGTISAQLLKPDGSVDESYPLDTPNMIDEQLSSEFIDGYTKRHWGKSPLCGTELIDRSCVGSIDFNSNGDILMYVNNGLHPC